jgi:hypothetical protein
MKVQRHIGCLLGLLVIGFAGSFATSDAWSQQKQSVSFSVPAGAARYTQEHLIDVGDVPGHQVRVFEIHTDYQNANLSFDGVKVKEAWVRGASDYTNGNGTAANYTVWVLEDGNKLFSRDAVVGHASVAADGSKVLKYSAINTFVGGTGKFLGIKGQLRVNSIRVPGAKTITTEANGEYWIEQ